MKEPIISQKNLNNIRSFLELIYYNHNATKEEVKDFLRNCMQFIFEINSIDVNNFDITFHFPQSKIFTKCEALVRADDKKEDKFDVYFNYEVFKVKNKIDTENYTYPISIAFHEFSHILQYILNRDELDIFDADNIEIHKIIDIISSKNFRSPEKQKAKKNLEKYLNCLESISIYEKEADSISYATSKLLFNTLLKNETNTDLSIFYLDCLNYLQFLRKEEHIIYRKFSKIKKDVVNQLKSSSIIEITIED